MNNEKELYRKKIIEMIEKIDNVDFLFKIYHYIIPKFKKASKAGKGGIE